MLETILDGADIPWPDEPPGSDRPAEPPAATTWEPVDLGPYFRGEVRQPEPSVGLARTDGLRLIYPGREHAVLGETESGKTWFALGCVAAEIAAGNHVLYIHYEEGDPGSTIERLRLLGVSAEYIRERLRFVAPARPVLPEWIAPLLVPAPTLVVHDGVNEGMALHGADIMAAEGAALFRRQLIMPCTRVGAATLACDHLPKNVEGRGRDAYGSVHKGNAIDGARIVLENVEPFGRGMRGASLVFVTKDRPGYLRSNGEPTRMPGKTFIGTLAVDGTGNTPDVLGFYAPKTDGAVSAKETFTLAEIGDLVHEVIAALPDGTVGSQRQLFAEMRRAGHAFREGAIKSAVDDLLVAGRVIEMPGKRGSTGYRAVLTAARPSSDEPLPATAAASASPIEGDARPQSQSECGPDSGSSGPQWAAVEANEVTE